MGLIGSAIGAAASIVGGIAASKKMGQVSDNLNQQMQDNQNWYDQRYNEDATQRADAQRILTMTEESIKNRNRQAAGTAAVMGGTDESTAAAKAANADALANATSQIAASADARKDKIENQYLQTQASLNGQINNLTAQQAQNIAKAAGSVGSASSNLPW